MTTEVVTSMRELTCAEFARLVGMSRARAAHILRSGAVPTFYEMNGRMYVTERGALRWQEERGR